MRRWSGLVVVVLVGACAHGALADAPLTHALPQATIGGSLTISAQRVDPGPYTMSMTDPTPQQGVICAARVAGPTRANKGNIKLTGRVPPSLACYESDGTLLSHVRVAAGTYMLVLCQSDGPTGCQGEHTEIQHQVVVHPAPTSHPKTTSH
jgi:hypothetical protein